MQTQPERIPNFTDNTFDGMLFWFAEMSSRGLIYHPDESADQIVLLADGKPMFTSTECEKLDGFLASMFKTHGDRVYDACYPIFMKAAGLPDFDA